jgi:hypothetical protein
MKNKSLHKKLKNLDFKIVKVNIAMYQKIIVLEIKNIKVQSK